MCIYVAVYVDFWMKYWLHVCLFLFPAVFALFDSMAHNMPPLPSRMGVRVEVRRGDTLWKLLTSLQEGDISVEGRAVVVVGVATNDLCAEEWFGNRSAEQHASGKMNLLRMLLAEVRVQNPSAYVVLLSVLPRPCDDERTSDCVKEYNRLLRAHAFGNRMGYIPTWTSFVQNKPHHEKAVIKDELYTAKQLHLNLRGANVLRRRLQQALSKSSLNIMAARAIPPVTIEW